MVSLSLIRAVNWAQSFLMFGGTIIIFVDITITFHTRTKIKWIVKKNEHPTKNVCGSEVMESQSCWISSGPTEAVGGFRGSNSGPLAP